MTTPHKKKRHLWYSVIPKLNENFWFCLSKMVPESGAPCWADTTGAGDAGSGVPCLCRGANRQQSWRKKSSIFLKEKVNVHSEPLNEKIWRNLEQSFWDKEMAIHSTKHCQLSVKWGAAMLRPKDWSSSTKLWSVRPLKLWSHGKKHDGHEEHEDHEAESPWSCCCDSTLLSFCKSKDSDLEQSSSNGYSLANISRGRLIAKPLPIQSVSAIVWSRSWAPWASIWGRTCQVSKRPVSSHFLVLNLQDRRVWKHTGLLRKLPCLCLVISSIFLGNDSNDQSLNTNYFI